MICSNCKQTILENEAYKQIPTGCPDGLNANGSQCLVSHMGTVHVDVGTGETDCIRPPSQIEKLQEILHDYEREMYIIEKRIELLERKAGGIQ